MELYSLSEVLREMPSYTELLQEKTFQLSHRERLEMQVPEIWEGIRTKRSIEHMYTFIPELIDTKEIKRKEEKSTLMLNAMHPIDGIKLFGYDGQPVCAVTARVKYKNNSNYTVHRGDKFTNKPDEMADNLKRLINTRKSTIEKANIYYNLWKAPENVLFEVYNNNLVTDQVEKFKQLYR